MDASGTSSDVPSEIKKLEDTIGHLQHENATL